MNEPTRKTTRNPLGGRALPLGFAAGVFASLVLATAGVEAALPEGTKVTWTSIASGGDPVPSLGNTISSFVAPPVLARNQLVFGTKVETLDTSHDAVLRAWLPQGTVEVVASAAAPLPGLAGPVLELGQGAFPGHPGYTVDSQALAFWARVQTANGATTALFSNAGGALALVASLPDLGSAGVGTEVPGPWLPTSQLGFTAPPEIAEVITVVPPPYRFHSSAGFARLSAGRLSFSASYLGRILLDGDASPLVERALVETQPGAAPPWTKHADPWFPLAVETTPEGAPVMRLPFGGSRGKSTLAWFDAAVIEPDTAVDSRVEHRVMVQATPPTKPVALAALEQTGAKVSAKGGIVPGQAQYRFATFGDALDLSAPVVSREGKRVVYWAASLPATFNGSAGLPSAQTNPWLEGVYRYEVATGNTSPVIHSNMKVPGIPAGKYVSFTGISADGNRVALTAAYSVPGAGVGTEVVIADGARRYRLVGTGDTVAGITVANVATSQQAIWGDRIAIKAIDVSGVPHVLVGTIDPPCAADLTGSLDPTSPEYGVPDGSRNRTDYQYFLERYLAQSLDADLSSSDDPDDEAFGVPDGTVNVVDFLYYRSVYFLAGCK